MLAQRERAESVYLAGRRDRDWFDAEDDRIAALLADLDAELAQLPEAIDRAALDVTAATISALDEAVAVLARDDPQALGVELRATGVRLIVDGDGVRWSWPSPFDRLIPRPSVIRPARSRKRAP